jgi:CRISPR-associated protein Csm4
MNLITLKIKPISNFGTIPKGDVIFGQIVSEFYFDHNKAFDDYLSVAPKLIVSDMMPFGYVYKPTLPIEYFECQNKNIDEKLLDKKAIKRKNFIKLEYLQDGIFENAEKLNFAHDINVVRNSISRLSGSTDGDVFAPYSVWEKNLIISSQEEKNIDNYAITPLWLFILVEKDIQESVLKYIEKIGKYGFGKNASTGSGCFDVEIVEIVPKSLKTDYYLSISPIVPQDTNIEECSYDIYVKFGKFGGSNADNKAFKKPVIMANSGAVVKLKSSKQYFGTCLNNGYEYKPSFLQGYSIAIPITMKELSHEKI